ncbi:MAG: hypothetical protein CMD27_02100 [Flavobacteriales bacterium]|nr:hypothetical protein [Flavobacteriales bacterium]|tara:strand:- start:690 stop:1514 length:825 start_codon:yes stop_codon:yes gene_type:complete
MGTGNSQIKKDGHLKLILYLDNLSLTHSTFNTSKKCFESIETEPIKTDPEKLVKHISQIIQKVKPPNLVSPALVAINIAQSTFIPAPLFDQKNISNYIEINKSSQPMDTHIYIKQKFTDCYAISSINKQIEQIFTKTFTKTIIKPFASILTDYAIYRSEKNKDEMLIHLENSQFSIVYLKNKQFIFYNQFKFDNENDFLYYFTNCLHILNVNQHNTKLNIISNLDKTHPYFNIMKDYIHHIIFLQKPDMFLYNHQLLDFQDYNNHHIFSQIICE